MARRRRLENYCPACGYSLLGSDDDPVRCPECGSQYPRTILRPTGRQITEQSARMDAASGLVLLGTLASGPVAWLLWFVTTAPARDQHPGVLAAPAVVEFVAVALMISGILRYRYVCRARRGWGWALLAQTVDHLFPIGIVVSLFAMFFTNTLRPVMELACLAGPLSLPLSIVAHRLIHPWVERVVEPLRHGLAVELAREEWERVDKKVERGTSTSASNAANSTGPGAQSE